MRYTVLRALFRCFSLEGRALALLRIALGVFVLRDLFSRYPDLMAHYTDGGVLSHAAARETFGLSTYLSIHFLFDSFTLMKCAFAAHAMAAGLLVIGWRTRWTAALTWYLTVSLHGRNDLVLYGGDHYLRILLFWLMWLPAGISWSWDARRSPNPQHRVFSVASFGLILQIPIMYGMAGLLKSGPEWRIDGTALEYALRFEQLSTPAAEWLLNVPALLKPLTFATVLFELSVPLLLLWPTRNRIPRLLALIALFAFHLGIGLFMNLYDLPWICMAALVVFVPNRFWNGIKRPRRRTETWRRVLHAAPRYRQHTAAAILLSVLGCFSLLSNFETIDTQRSALPEFARNVVHVLRLEQDWSFFAPYPYKNDGWYVISGSLTDATLVSPFEGVRSAPNSQKPVSVSSTFPNVHWLAYLIQIRDSRYRHLLHGFSQYLCRSWQSTQYGDNLDSIDIRFILEPTVLGARAPAQIEIELEKLSCRDL